MIVNTTQEGWEVIYQRAHGLLAVQIAQYWQPEQRPERWVETLAAITEHDDSQEAWHQHYHLTEAGAPKDFTLQEFSLKQAQSVTRMAAYKSRWVGLLISYHISFLYENMRGQSSKIDTFLNGQKKNQQIWRKELGLKKDVMEKAYALMQWCDRCSLILCKNELPDGERDLEVYHGPGDEKYFIRRRNDNTLIVEPWPFQINTFEVWVESRELHQIKFESDNALARALAKTAVKYKKWFFKK